jgi:hypothetical protein
VAAVYADEAAQTEGFEAAVSLRLPESGLGCLALSCPALTGLTDVALLLLLLNRRVLSRLACRIVALTVAWGCGNNVPSWFSVFMQGNKQSAT